MPAANPDATVMFPAGVPTGGEAGKSELLLMILRYIKRAKRSWPTTGGRHELMAGKKAIAGPQAGRIIPREAGPW